MSQGNSPDRLEDKEDGSRDVDRGRSKEYSDARGQGKRSRSNSKSRSRSRSVSDDTSHRHRRRRSRSRSRERRSRHHRRRRDRSYSSGRSPSRDRYRRRRDDSRDRRYRGRRPRRTAEPAETEQKKLESAYRTVQVYQLSLRAEDRDVFNFFKVAGPVADIKIIRDRNTRRSEGFAYVEFQNVESVANALALSGQQLLGQPVMVKPSEAEKNMAWEAAQAAKKLGGDVTGDIRIGMPTNGSVELPGRLLASNTPINVTESDLRPILEPFGELVMLTVQRDGMGVSQGTALVQYKLASDAMVAAQKLNEERIELAPGLPMRLDSAPLDGAANMQAAPGLTAEAIMQAQLGNVAPEQTLEEKIDIDADDGGGMRLTAQTRMALMSRLAATAGIELPQPIGAGGYGLPLPGGAPAAADAHIPADLLMMQGVLGPASPIPTQCLLLKNMFDPEEERAREREEGGTGDAWVEEIRQDVETECLKHGTVIFAHVDADSSKGFVYVKFDSVEAATRAQKAIHGRWFAKRPLVAEFQFNALFNAHFGLQ